ncbi:Putative AC transposase, partial [Linum perenne]
GESIKKVICDLVLEYQQKLEKISIVGSGTKHDFNARISSVADLDFEIRVRQRKKSKTTLVTTELDHFLVEDITLRRSVDFDLLMWWKLNGAKYPTLQKIARDLIAITVTFIAFVSAFSSGGRSLDPHHRRLHFTLVETMMCTRSWINEDIKRGIFLYFGSLYGNFYGDCTIMQ